MSRTPPFSRSNYYRNPGLDTGAEFHCYLAEEGLKFYRKGGYHPTILGDTFKDGRYEIIDKLGWGRHGTVWLAKNSKLRRHVALKISTSERYNDDTELRILKRLAEGSTKHPGKKHVLKLLDHFDHTGPNGTHTCLATELLGPTIESLTEYERNKRLPGRIAWEVSKQLLQAVNYIHTNGIVHGELRPENIAFATQSEDALLQRPKRPRTSWVRAISGEPLPSRVPKYQVSSTPLPSPINKSQHPQTKIIDFGEAVLDGQLSPAQPPLEIRGFGDILPSTRDKQTDIWRLGCTMCEMMVGSEPIHGAIRGLGVVPYGPVTENKEPEDEGADTSLQEWMITQYFEQEVDYDDDEEEKPNDFTKEDLMAAADLLKWMMQDCIPAECPQASELLGRAWFHHNPFH